MISSNEQISLNEQLFKAYYDNDFVTFKQLLKNPKVDINCVNNCGYTVLSHATDNNEIEFVSLLLKHKNIDVNFIDNNNYTPLFMTCFNGYEEIAFKLLEHKNIDLSQINICLDIAYAYGHNKIMKKLLKNKKININLQCNGSTIFMHACKKSDTKIVLKLLKRKDIDVNISDEYSYTGFMNCCLNRNYEIIEILLKNYKTDINIQSCILYNYIKTIPQMYNMIVKEQTKRKEYITKELLYCTTLCNDLIKLCVGYIIETES